MAGKKSGSVVTLPKIPIPQDIKEAGELLARLGAMQRQAKTVSDKTDAAISKLQEEANAELTPIYGDMGAAFDALKAFADVRRRELTQDGKKKTVDLGTGKVFWRNTPPRVSVQNEAAVLAAVQELKLTDFFRVEPQLDKQAMNKNPDGASVIPGVEITREELFYAKPTDGTGELNQHKLDGLLKSRD
ncbi:MAG: host-nuclease inhibitor Gam family protein [Patescibacteria group bacterium]